MNHGLMVLFTIMVILIAILVIQREGIEFRQNHQNRKP